MKEREHRAPQRDSNEGRNWSIPLVSGHSFMNAIPIRRPRQFIMDLKPGDVFVLDGWPRDGTHLCIATMENDRAGHIYTVTTLCKGTIRSDQYVGSMLIRRLV